VSLCVCVCVCVCIFVSAAGGQLKASCMSGNALPCSPMMCGKFLNTEVGSYFYTDSSGNLI
jgi:hypothetical protein